MCRSFLAVVLIASTSLIHAGPPETAVGTQESIQTVATKIEFFERKVRPLLVQHCFECHSAQADPVHGGLRIDASSTLTAGGDSGPVVIPGKPDASLLITAVRYEDGIEMPPQGKLSAAEIAVLTEWVRQGAVFPDSGAPRQSDDRIDFDQGRKFWSFQPVRRQPLLVVSNSDWTRQRLDHFIAAGHQQHGLRPSPRADRDQLVRRIYFRTIGLPPTAQQVTEFVNDSMPGSDVRLVDRLLQSPRFGERWARWWLDMARYTDRTADWLYPTGEAHFYRDWVIAALNDDMPYDDFVRRQLATDLMPETDLDDLPALGFLSLSPTYWKELKLPCEVIKTIVADEWEERVDVVSRTFLGLTVACARCHDHKFDPISSEDYYALAGVFASTRQIERALLSEKEFEPIRQARQRVSELEKELNKQRKVSPTPKEAIASLVAEINAIKSETPGYETPMVASLAEESLYVVRAGETPQEGTRLEYRPGPRDLPCFVRGDPNRPGPIVPRRFLTVLSTSAEPFRHGSGRLELANAITRDAAPLAARVIVNRIWMAYFGRGLVDTPSNFGQQGGRPSHPELLDDLAARLIENGWSLKWLHREILLSAAWQQSSHATATQLQRDPENRYLSRMNRRRLDFECWRDAMLMAGGTLDRTIGGESVALDSEANHRRTLYATIHRRDMSPTLMVHDFPDPTQHSPMRTPTVTALQGLYALNGPLLLRQARTISQRIRAIPDLDDSQRIDQLYWTLFARAPTEVQQQAGIDFLRSGSGGDDSTRWQAYIHVLLASNEFAFID